MSSLSIAVVVPTLNAAGDWAKFAPALLLNVRPDQVLILDSCSTDGTAELARQSGFRVHQIARSDFNHGGTRQVGAELLGEAEVLVYLTQDAVLADAGSIERLCASFADPMVSAAYGRQLPRPGAGAIESHARWFNYPAVSSVRSLETREQQGIKTIFISNSFSAYRRRTLMELGGFARHTIFGEDTMMAGRMVLAGWKIAYVAEAQAYHSHGYTWRQDFRRYFDIGALHRQESWMLEEFGRAGGEGKRFVLSELGYLWREDAGLIGSALVRTGLKLAGYRLGQMEHRLSVGWKRRLSMHPGFWR